MEIKAQLNKPYSDKQRADFIVENNHNKGYDIKETETALEAWGLTAEEQAQKELDDKKASVRGVRNSYLETYVDPYQLVIRWSTLTEQEKTDLVNYRQYLLDYTQAEEWWESQPLTFDEWKEEPVTEENEDVTSVSVDNTDL